MAALHRICFLILSPRQHKDTFESAPPNVIKNEVGKNKKEGKNNREELQMVKISPGRNEIERQL